MINDNNMDDHHNFSPKFVNRCKSAGPRAAAPEVALRMPNLSAQGLGAPNARYIKALRRRPARAPRFGRFHESRCHRHIVEN